MKLIAFLALIYAFGTELEDDFVMFQEVMIKIFFSADLTVKIRTFSSVLFSLKNQANIFIPPSRTNSLIVLVLYDLVCFPLNKDLTILGLNVFQTLIWYIHCLTSSLCRSRSKRAFILTCWRLILSCSCWSLFLDFHLSKLAMSSDVLLFCLVIHFLHRAVSF